MQILCNFLFYSPSAFRLHLNIISSHNAFFSFNYLHMQLFIEQVFLTLFTWGIVRQENSILMSVSCSWKSKTAHTNTLSLALFHSSSSFSSGLPTFSLWAWLSQRRKKKASSAVLFLMSKPVPVHLWNIAVIVDYFQLIFSCPIIWFCFSNKMSFGVLWRILIQLPAYLVVSGPVQRTTTMFEGNECIRNT